MSQTNAQLLADSLGTASTGIIPIGGIILWSGSVATIPDGYALCNGSNGTPNLRNKFILGAYSDNASVAYPNVPPNSTGGSANAVLIGHNHGITDPGHDHTQTGGGTDDDGGSNVPGSTSGGTQSNIADARTGITIKNNGINSSGNANSNQTGTNANIPPYYSLAYIMRTS
jgi:hypothetical protein